MFEIILISALVAAYTVVRSTSKQSKKDCWSDHKGCLETEFYKSKQSRSDYRNAAKLYR
jgi:hypothetical protein